MGNQMTGEQTTVPAYKPTASFSAAIALNGTGITNIVNVTEEGKLSSIGIYVATAATGTPTVTLEIQVDGQTTQSIALFTAGISFAPAIRGWASTDLGGIGDAGGQRTSLMIPINLEYQASLRVGINVSVAGSGGSLDVNVMRGKRL